MTSEEAHIEFYEGFFRELPEFEVIRSFIDDDARISITHFFFGHFYLYIVKGLSQLTKEKNRTLARKAEYYLKRMLDYIVEIYNKDFGGDMLDIFAYNLYKVGDEYDTVLSHAPEIISKEVERVNAFYDIPDPNLQDKSAYKKLISAVQNAVRKSQVKP